jgi:undecaprenyl-diphosphatase
LPIVVQNFDLFLSTAIRAWQNPVLTIVASFVTAITYGGLIWWIIAAILWWRGYRILAVEIAVALGIGLLEVAVLKHIFHRPRPILAPLNGFWLPIQYMFADQYSFPSGHAILSFAPAVVLLKAMPDWRGWLIIFFAFLVGLCRVYQGMHWPTDVIAGMVFGVAASVPAFMIAPKFFERNVESVGLREIKGKYGSNRDTR